MNLKDQMRQNTIPIYLMECSLFIFLGLVLPVATSWAQSVCPEDFSQINTKCIANSSNVAYSEAQMEY